MKNIILGYIIWNINRQTIKNASRVKGQCQWCLKKAELSQEMKLDWKPILHQIIIQMANVGIIFHRQHFQVNHVTLESSVIIFTQFSVSSVTHRSPFRYRRSGKNTTKYFQKKTKNALKTENTRERTHQKKKHKNCFPFDALCAQILVIVFTLGQHFF